MSKDAKSLYRVVSQTKGFIMTTTYENELAYEAVLKLTKIKMNESNEIEKFYPFVITELTTKERWDRGTINFCPRCGERIEDLEGYANFDCYECGASCCVVIDVGEEDE